MKTHCVCIYIEHEKILSFPETQTAPTTHTLLFCKIVLTPSLKKQPHKKVKLPWQYLTESLVKYFSFIDSLQCASLSPFV